MNRSYSLRSFARDVGLSHTYLSLVFRNKKPFPVKTLHAVVKRLGIDPKTFPSVPELFMEDAENSDAFRRLEIDKFRFFTRWYHTAILELAEIQGFPLTAQHSALYLGLDTEPVREALSLLRRLGLLKLDGRRWVKTQSKLSIEGTTSLEAIRTYHRHMITKALDELSKTDHYDFKKRDITALTMPINPRRISGAKKRIAQFRRSLEAYLTKGNCTEVYQLNLQLFPLRGAGKTERPLWEYQ